MLDSIIKKIIKKPERSPIEALQEYLTKHGYGGMIIPHTDSFQNTPSSPESNRLQVLFDFKGSAGLGIVLENAAALFVDGRYILEAQNLISPSLEVFLWTQKSIQDFLDEPEKTSKKLILGFDPLLISKNCLEDLKKLDTAQAIEWRTMDPNPIDVLFKTTCHDGHSKSPPYLYTQGEEDQPFSSKCDFIAQALSQKGCEGFFLSSPESLNWLLNLRGTDTAYTPLFLARGVLYADGTVDVFSDQKISAELNDYFGARIRFLPSHEQNFRLKEVAGSLWADPITTPSAVATYLEEACAVIWGEDLCMGPKSVRGPRACDQVDQAHKKDGAALVSVLKELLDGDRDHRTLTESGLAAKVDESRSGFDLYVSPSFQTIVGFGPNGAIIHYHPSPETDRELGENELVLIDSGGQYLDGTTDVTRTVWVGSQIPPKEIIDAYTAVLKGHIALASVRFPKGTTGAHLDVLARQFLWARGWNYNHGTGHGVGHFMNVHEGPQGISQRGSQIALVPGMVVSNEPGYYPEGAFGIRLENLMMVELSPKENFYHFKTLTRVPYQSALIDMSKITQEEIRWINTYHQEVQTTLEPLVTKEVYRWLKDQTKAI